MREIVEFIVSCFLKSLKEFKLGFVVTNDGDFIFINEETGEKLKISKENMIKAYNEL